MSDQFLVDATGKFMVDGSGNFILVPSGHTAAECHCCNTDPCSPCAGAHPTLTVSGFVAGGVNCDLHNGSWSFSSFSTATGICTWNFKKTFIIVGVINYGTGTSTLTFVQSGFTHTFSCPASGTVSVTGPSYVLQIGSPPSGPTGGWIWVLGPSGASCVSGALSGSGSGGFSVCATGGCTSSNSGSSIGFSIV